MVGIPKEKALPIILTIHGSQFIFVVSIGLISMLIDGLRLNPSFTGINAARFPNATVN